MQCISALFNSVWIEKSILMMPISYSACNLHSPMGPLGLRISPCRFLMDSLSTPDKAIILRLSKLINYLLKHLNTIYFRLFKSFHIHKFTLNNDTWLQVILINLNALFIFFFIPIFLHFLFVLLLLNSSLCVYEQDDIQEPSEIINDHSIEDRLKPSKPYIKVFTCLWVEGTFIVWISIYIILHYHKIRCRPN